MGRQAPKFCNINLAFALPLPTPVAPMAHLPRVLRPLVCSIVDACCCHLVRAFEIFPQPNPPPGHSGFRSSLAVWKKAAPPSAVVTTSL
ncbi:hypothetical protein IWZ03DRAFT_130883 [Phyllosticta citriasiana]|uniref:Secreted protein n=1 Tax=Phyllosticta citriasiana TaxID=595635 RepID=A0ABR1KRI9_9PEZI